MSTTLIRNESGLVKQVIDVKGLPLDAKKAVWQALWDRNKSEDITCFFGEDTKVFFVYKSSTFNGNISHSSREFEDTATFKSLDEENQSKLRSLFVKPIVKNAGWIFEGLDMPEIIIKGGRKYQLVRE